MQYQGSALQTLIGGTTRSRDYIWFLLAMFSISHAVFAVEMETDLQKRVTAAWDAKINGDWEKVYAFLAPKIRKRVSLDTYLNLEKPLIFNSYKIEKIEIDKDKARIRITAKYSLAKYPISKEESFWRIWKKVEGIWYESEKKKG
jgi:hypothetical protein